MAAETTTYRMWKRLDSVPGGTRLFSAAAMARVPYFASIVPHVVHMEPGFAEVTVPKWFFVKRVEVVPLTGFPAGTRFVPQRQPALGDILPQTAEIQATSSTFRLWQALPRRVRVMRGERSPRIATA